MNVSNWKHLVHWKITVHRRDPGKICLMMERKVVPSLMYGFFFLSFPPFLFIIPLQNQNPGGDKPQSTAEQDMELIRTKRASSTAGSGAASGLPKSKYRKRSVRNLYFYYYYFSCELILVYPAGKSTR